MSTTKNIALAVLSGCLIFLSHPTALEPELSFWPLIWISHVPLFWLLKDKSPKQAFWWGGLAGFVVGTGGYYWLVEMLRIFGGLPIFIATPVMLLHSAKIGVIWAVWAWCLNRITNTTSIPIEWAAPIVFVAAEFLMPRIFPAYMGNSQFHFPLIMQIIDLFGITVVTFLVIRVNAIFFLWLRAWREGRPRPIGPTWLTLGLMVASLIYGAIRMKAIDSEMESAKTLRVGLVEADIGIFQVETQERQDDHLLIQQRMSQALEADGAELIVWPESAHKVPFPREIKEIPQSEYPLVKSRRQDRAPRLDQVLPQRGFKTPLLFGGVTSDANHTPRFEGDDDIGYRNTALLVGSDGQVLGTYDKVILLAFGEYVPFIEYMPWFYEMVPAAGKLVPGDRRDIIEAELSPGKNVRIGALICYEGLLPDFVHSIGSKKPHFFANLTNDDWFGKTAERYLHMYLTVLGVSSTGFHSYAVR